MEVIANVNYRKVEEIGKAGQNSQVFRAFDNYLQAEVAVKEVEKTRLGDPSRFFTEARALHASAHARVVPIRWAAETATHVCIAMPLMGGGSLADMIETGPMRPSEVIRIGQDICEGVAQVHLANFVHLDIKPSNVLFDQARASITDFGLALRVDQFGTADARDQAIYPSFLPPEIVLSRGVVTHASDVYQIGLTLYRMVNGEPLFAEQWERIRSPWPAGRTAISEGRFPDRSFLPGVPLGLRQAILRALSVDPALRPVGARQLAEELAAVNVKHDWEVEEFAPASIKWRLKTAGRADVLVFQYGSVPNVSIEVWTETAAGRRRKAPKAWSTDLRTQKQVSKALSRAFRAAES